MLKVVSFTYVCLVVVLNDFVLEKDENYYPQFFKQILIH